MNHLAHAFLAADTAESLIGNLAGDFFKGPIARHDPRLREAIRFHRRVDSFTDSHAAVSASKKRIAQPFGHYSGIIIDVYYDHLLAGMWREFSDEPLEDFAARTYRTLQQHPELIPPVFASSLPRMIDDDWLVRYRTEQGVSRALYFLSRRLRKAPPLHESLELLALHREALQEDFLSFFPHLIAMKLFEPGRSVSEF